MRPFPGISSKPRKKLQTEEVKRGRKGKDELCTVPGKDFREDGLVICQHGTSFLGIE